MLENENYKILYQKPYVGRVLFIILDKTTNKVIPAYKSSGYSGTGNKGEILPFMYLEEEHRLYTPRGYINKILWLNNRFQMHEKVFRGKIKDKLDSIKDFVEDIGDSRTIEEIDRECAKETSYKNVHKINIQLKEILSEYKLFDFELDI